MRRKKHVCCKKHYSWANIFRRLFSTGALLGHKAGLNLWYVDTRPNSQKVFPIYEPNMTDLQILGSSFCEFDLVSTYQRFSAPFWPKSAPFWKWSYKDVGPAAICFKLMLVFDREKQGSLLSIILKSFSNQALIMIKILCAKNVKDLDQKEWN